jgi:hypothetical protein
MGLAELRKRQSFNHNAGNRAARRLANPDDFAADTWFDAIAQ